VRVADERTPENIPPALLAQADQLQANADAKGPEIHALMEEAAAEAAQQKAHDVRELSLDEEQQLIADEMRLRAELDGPPAEDADE